MIKSAVGLALVASLLLSTSASAQQERLLGEHRAWTRYAANDAAGAVCFAMTKPEAVTPSPDGYTQAYIYTPNRPASILVDHFILVACLPFLADSKGTVAASSNVFNLFAQNVAAWLDDAG